jgi:serine/threonine protein phosphatase PrpC
MTSALGDTCPSCANLVVAGDAFCETCGSSLGAAPDAEAVGTPVVRRIDLFVGACPSCGAPLRRSGDGYCEMCGMREPDPRDHLEVSVTGAAGVSDKGRRRQNQDAFALAAEPAGRVMAVICDGVSASTRPEEAAAAATEAALGALLAAPPGQGLDRAYLAALHATADVRWDPAHDHAGPPSCTLIAAAAVVDRAQLLSVGDCRAFWLPDQGEPRTLTEDDSWASDQVAAGTMTAEQAYADDRSHVITRWLGADSDLAWEPRCVDFVAPEPGRLVLCSDGLWNYAASAAQVAAAAGRGDPLAICHRLVRFAIRGGGHDNVTVVVIDLPRGPAGGRRRAPKGHRP